MLAQSPFLKDVLSCVRCFLLDTPQGASGTSGILRSIDPLYSTGAPLSGVLVAAGTVACGTDVVAGLPALLSDGMVAEGTVGEGVRGSFPVQAVMRSIKKIRAAIRIMFFFIGGSGLHG